MIELQMLLEDVYSRSGYEYFLDYQENLNVPLEDVDKIWLKDKVIVEINQKNNGDLE